MEHFFLAYFDCRENKKNKEDTVLFETDYERELVKLWREVNSGNYKVSPLDVFISETPVKREIFAAQFRDRIIHHLIINKLEHIFEKEFIYDSYSCRKGKGTHFGIERVKKHIRRCSENYKEDCHILKMDIQGYFMSINKNILLKKLEKLINKDYKEKDKERVIDLCKTIIKTDPIKDCVRKSPRKKWNNLPKSKSLFYAKENCGLPIGNYTNQILANLYLTSFDHFIKHKLGVRYYARYVDDFIIIQRDKECLKSMIPKIKNYLEKELQMTLHPRKTYLQHYKKGVEFLGVLIKPRRSYVTKRIKKSFWEAVESINEKLEKGKLTEEKEMQILSRINSFLGVLTHSNTHNLKKNC